MANLFKSNAGPRQSLESFKANAATVQASESIEKITGGALSGCHKLAL